MADCGGREREVARERALAAIRNELAQECTEARNLRFVGFDPDAPPPDGVQARAADLSGPGKREATSLLLRREAARAIFPEQCVGEDATDRLLARMGVRISAMVNYVAKSWDDSVRRDQLTAAQRADARERAHPATRDGLVRQRTVQDLRMFGFDPDAPPPDGVRARAVDLSDPGQREARRSLLVREAATVIFPEHCVGEDAIDRFVARMRGRASAMVHYVAKSWDDSL